MNSLYAIVGVLGALLLGLLGYWLFIVTEGAYFGRRVVAFLYDWGASSYDDVKQFTYSDEFVFLAKPLFDRVSETAGTHALVLDVATGTGRLPLALVDIPFFEGEVVGLDVSRKMLEQAALKFDAIGAADRVHLVRHPAVPLPFADEAFDAVVMLEALEFLPDRQTALSEMVRVLRPGGWFLVSNRIGLDAAMMPGRVDPPERFEARLSALGLERIFTKSWQTYYSLVWARKPGTITPRDAVPNWFHRVRCPACGTVPTRKPDDGVARCERCGRTMWRERGVWDV